MENNCCVRKTKQRDETEYKSLINRLNRIEGQIRGIKNMVEKLSNIWYYIGIVSVKVS